MKIFNKTKAYTLAETLLTLVIIGIISALTIPTLKHNADEKKFVTLTQKAFNTISDATVRLETKYGNSNFWNSSNYPKWYKEVMNFDLGAPVNTNVKSTSFAGSSYTLWNSNNTYIGADGMYWRIDTKKEKDAPNFIVDINGPQLPNVIGIDIHAFFLTEDGIVPQGLPDTSTGAPWTQCCTAYVLKYGKMPWLNTSMQKCPSL